MPSFQAMMLLVVKNKYLQSGCRGSFAARGLIRLKSASQILRYYIFADDVPVTRNQDIFKMAAEQRRLLGVFKYIRSESQQWRLLIFVSQSSLWALARRHDTPNSHSPTPKSAALTSLALVLTISLQIPSKISAPVPRFTANL